MWNECYPSGLLPVGTRETGPGTVTLGATRGGAWRRGKSSSTGCGESSGIPRRRFGHSRERSGGNDGYGIETRREIVGARECVRDADIDSSLAARRLRQQQRDEYPRRCHETSGDDRCRADHRRRSSNDCPSGSNDGPSRDDRINERLLRAARLRARQRRPPARGRTYAARLRRSVAAAAHSTCSGGRLRSFSTTTSRTARRTRMRHGLLRNRSQ